METPTSQTTRWKCGQLNHSWDDCKVGDEISIASTSLSAILYIEACPETGWTPKQKRYFLYIMGLSHKKCHSLLTFLPGKNANWSTILRQIHFKLSTLGTPKQNLGLVLDLCILAVGGIWCYICWHVLAKHITISGWWNHVDSLTTPFDGRTPIFDSVVSPMPRTSHFRMVQSRWTPVFDASAAICRSISGYILPIFDGENLALWIMIQPSSYDFGFLHFPCFMVKSSISAMVFTSNPHSPPSWGGHLRELQALRHLRGPSAAGGGHRGGSTRGRGDLPTDGVAPWDGRPDGPGGPLLGVWDGGKDMEGSYNPQLIHL